MEQRQLADVNREPALSQTNPRTPSDQIYMLDADRVRLVTKLDKLKVKIDERSRARHVALCRRMKLPAACDLRASTLADWNMQREIEKERTKNRKETCNVAFDDDLTVRLFAEHTAQRLLEKAVAHVIFPTATPIT